MHMRLTLLHVLLLVVLGPLLPLLLLMVGRGLLAVKAYLLLLLPCFLLWWLALLPGARMLVLALQDACSLQVLLLCVLVGWHARLVRGPMRLLLHLPLLLLLLLHGVAAWRLLHARKALLCCSLPTVLVLSLLMLPLLVLQRGFVAVIPLLQPLIGPASA
jgi:hypothetical protein